MTDSARDPLQLIEELRAEVHALRTVAMTALMTAKYSYDLAGSLAILHPNPQSLLYAFNATVDASAGQMQYSTATDDELALLEKMQEDLRVLLQKSASLQLNAPEAPPTSGA
jgi:hypothetical protein